MNKNTEKWQKVKRRLKSIIVNKIEGTPFQFSCYRSYWHYKLSGKKNIRAAHNEITPPQYLSQKPNYGAGIGHQLANWNTGYYYSKNMAYSSHIFLSPGKNWEYFLGFGENESDAGKMLNDGNFKKVKLPRFDSSNPEHILLIGRIIQSYKNKKALFLLEQDQGYMIQCDTASDLSRKFFQAPARKENKLFYIPGTFNIALHIRRGDIVALKNASQSQGEQRWLDNNYYVNVLKQVVTAIPPGNSVQVYLFSQGVKEDFSEFSSFSNIHFCLDVNAIDSFLHMACADVLITSKSSFSYKPALISKGIKICPENFWHKYPPTMDFILTGDNGNFDQEKLATQLVGLKTGTKKNPAMTNNMFNRQNTGGL